MEILKSKKTKVWMLILVLLMQIALPAITILVENSFTLVSTATDVTEWDISVNGDGSVKAVLDEEGTLTISGAENMKDWSTAIETPWYDVRTQIKKVIIDEGVTSIGALAFNRCENLTEVTIPASVTRMGEYAFFECINLTTITIPEAVPEIKYMTFYMCRTLESINIPAGVRSIEEFAFEYCTSLKSITVEEGNANYISQDGILYNKEKTELVSYPAGKTETKFEIPDGITSIENGAFVASTSLKSITIPSSVTNIGEYAFLESAVLENIEIPENVSNIGRNAFAAISTLKSINVAENNTRYMSQEGVLYNKEKTKLVCYPAGKTDENITILGEVTNIGEYAFRGCKKIKSIIIPEGVVNIERYAFYQCDNLEKVIIPEGLTSIGNWVFEYCNQLSTIAIPDSVESIGQDIFYNCENITIYCRTGSEAENYCKTNELVYEIDDEAPVISDTAIELGDGQSIVTIRATDIKVGLAEKAYSFDGGATWQAENTKIYTEGEQNAIIQVRDLLGNIATVTKDIVVTETLKIEFTTYEVEEEEGLKYLINVTPKTSITNALKNISTNGIMEIYKGTTEVTDNNKIIATGMKLKIALGDQEETYVIVVRGDTTGDGQADIKDILSINKHRLNKTPLAGEYLKAGNVTGDANVDIMDILQINKFRLGKVDSL